MRVLVADDHPLYREAVARQIMRLLPEATVEEAASMEAAMAAAQAAPPSLFVFDYYMPGMSAQAIARLSESFVDVPILVLSGGASPQEVQAVLQAGARGFLPKTATPEQFNHTIHMILAGGTSVPAELLLPLAGMSEGAPAWIAALTPRESDVLRAVARGLSNKEIARELNLAEVTIKLHLSAIFRKMDVRSRTEAAMQASKAGFL